VQLGSPDMPLELWFTTWLVVRRVDLYLDTLYSAFEMIASGITTVQHLHGCVAGDLAAVEAGQVLRIATVKRPCGSAAPQRVLPPKR